MTISRNSSDSDKLSPTQILEREHRLVLRMVNVLTSLRSRVDTGQVDREALRSAMEFFKFFVDTCHHGKEEDLLFPMLERRGVRPQGCPVGILRTEHEQGRRLVAALSDAVAKYETGDAKAMKTISSLLSTAISMYTDHVWKEDYLLFPMAEKVLTTADRADLLRDFEEADLSLGLDFQEKYETLVRQLEQKQANPTGQKTDKDQPIRN